MRENEKKWQQLMSANEYTRMNFVVVVEIRAFCTDMYEVDNYYEIDLIRKANYLSEIE